MRAGQEFFNLYNHDFVRVAVGVPAVRVADPDFNAEQTIALMRLAAERQAVLVLFPELGLSASDVQSMTEQLRRGLAAKTPPVRLEAGVAVDEVYVVAGHKGQPAAVAKWFIWHVVSYDGDVSSVGEVPCVARRFACAR